jgi:hypothetical protein
MEVWALMRIAFSAARVALSKSGINKIAVRSFAGERQCMCATRIGPAFFWFDVLLRC